MNDFYKKAIVLMQGALKKYEENNIEAAEKERQQANDMFDKCKVQTLKKDDEKIIYGENKNFGIIYNIIESNTKKWFFSPKKQKAIKEIIDCINHDAVLKEQFQVYNSCKAINENLDSKQYVTELFNCAKNLSIKSINESNQKLIDIINKYHGNVLIKIPDNKIKLYESIEYLLTHSPMTSLGNVQEYMLNKENISSYLNENRISTKSSNIDDIINNINNYDDLNVNEQKFMDYINKYNTIDEAFNDLKNNISSNVTSIINNTVDDTKERWKNVYEQVSHIEYDKNNLDGFIKLFEIYDKLEDK